MEDLVKATQQMFETLDSIKSNTLFLLYINFYDKFYFINCPYSVAILWLSYLWDKSK